MKEIRNQVWLTLALLVVVLLIGSAVCSNEPLAMSLRRGTAKSLAGELTSAERLTIAFANLQNYWRQQFSANDDVYSGARLILFREAVTTPCGELLGSFYCPLDRSVYIDLGRHSPLRDQPASWSDTYLLLVLVHEVGHHVQGLRGIEAETARRKLQHPDTAAAITRQLELQADCIAGMSWRAAGNDEVAESTMKAFAGSGITESTIAARIDSFRYGFATARLSECSFDADRLLIERNKPT